MSEGNEWAAICALSAAELAEEEASRLEKKRSAQADYARTLDQALAAKACAKASAKAEERAQSAKSAVQLEAWRAAEETLRAAQAAKARELKADREAQIRAKEEVRARAGLIKKDEEHVAVRELLLDHKLARAEEARELAERKERLASLQADQEAAVAEAASRKLAERAEASAAHEVRGRRLAGAQRAAHPACVWAQAGERERDQELHLAAAQGLRVER